MHKRSLLCASNGYSLAASPAKRHLTDKPRFGFTDFIMRALVNNAFKDDLLEFTINLMLECKPHSVYTQSTAIESPGCSNAFELCFFFFFWTVSEMGITLQWSPLPSKFLLVVHRVLPIILRFKSKWFYIYSFNHCHKVIYRYLEKVHSNISKPSIYSGCCAQPKVTEIGRKRK